LLAVTAEIYRISSASNDVVSLPSPVDTLRQFLATGVLHSNYLASTTLAPADLAAASAAAGQILSSITTRPTTNVTLLVRADTFSSDCVPLDPLAGVTLWSLFLASGRPFRLLEDFSLPPGSKVHVFGFTDIPSHGCPGTPIEVIALGLDSVPAVSSIDTDGDLLPDDLEMLLFGNLDQSGYGDADGDGISNLAEFLNGTDPFDPASKPGNPAKADPPEVQVTVQNGQLVLMW